ncbi:flagellar hook-length control protein FliK [Yoonia sp.]|uniref:flagellar hook-length control protein FliK n=1 Tax=Yoonia sp. TaxID=2212373 RepID=UPI00358EFB8E
MIPLIQSEPGTASGQPAARADVPRDRAAGIAFGDLMESPEIPLATMVADTDVAVDANLVEKDAATSDSWPMPIAPEGPADVVKVAGSLLLAGPKGASTDVDGVMALPGDTDASRRIPQAIVPEGGLRDQDARVIGQADAPRDDSKAQRSSVAQSLVEGRLPQAATPEAEQQRTALAGMNQPVADAAAPRPAVLPDVDHTRTPTLEQKTGPKMQAGAIPDENPHPSKDEAPRLATARSVPTIPAVVQPPAVALAQVATQLQDKTVEPPLKVAEGEVTIASAPVERHGPTAGSQVAVTSAGSPETARHVATQIAVAITNNVGKSTEIALNPEELGRVRLSLSVNDGAITLNVVAERPETQDLLRRHMDLLAQEFRQLGYTSISFSFGEQNGAAHSDSQQSDEVADIDLTEVVDAVRISPEPTLSGLDLRI